MNYTPYYDCFMSFNNIFCKESFHYHWRIVLLPVFILLEDGVVGSVESIVVWQYICFVLSVMHVVCVCLNLSYSSTFQRVWRLLQDSNVVINISRNYV